MSVHIRAERASEVDAIRRVIDAAFSNADDAAIVEGMRGTADWIEGGSLVAVDDEGAVIGHALLSLGRLVAAAGGEWQIGMLGPVAVLPARQRQGVGGALMRAAISVALERDLPLVCVLGHPWYYPRFGFERARALGIDPPQDWPDDAWMVLRLPGWAPEMRGVAHYAPAFNAG